MSTPIDKITIAKGHHLSFVRRGHWEFVERKKLAGIVVILAVTDDRKLVLVEQYRPPVQKSVIELPAGLVGDLPGEEDESLITGARRELLEETGYDAVDWTLLATGAPSAGLTDEMLHVFRARRLKKVGEGGGDESENIKVHEVDLNKVPEWLDRQQAGGAVIDLKIYMGLYFT